MVMLDCGVHPGYSGLASLPFFDEVELDKVREAAHGRCKQKHGGF